MTPQQIKTLRMKLRLTQVAFAALMGVSFTTANRWENGHTKPQPDRLVRLKQLLRKGRVRMSDKSNTDDAFERVRESQKSTQHILDELEKLGVDSDNNLKRLNMVIEGEHITWERRSPQLRRKISIYPQTLTPEQRERLNQIEQELVAMADEATEEIKTKTILKAQKGEAI